MKTKSIKKNTKGLLENAMGKTKKFVVNANDLALAKTEKAVTTSIEITAQWQMVADKAIKGGLQLAANQQDLIFDVLTDIKKNAKETKKRFGELVA